MECPNAEADDVQAQIAVETLRLLRTVNALAEDDSFRRIVARLLSLADAVILPDGIAGNIALAAALMNRDPRTIERNIAAGVIPSTKPNGERIIRFSDIGAPAEQSAE